MQDRRATRSHIASLPDELLSAILQLLNNRTGVPIAKFVCRLWNMLKRRKCRSTYTEFCAKPAAEGHLSILQWVMPAPSLSEQNQHQICSFAARRGHLVVLKWLREIGCAWDKVTCFNAAKSGNVEMLKWARENGCMGCWHLFGTC